MNNKIESVFSGWQVVRQLGVGGFGAVYEIQRDVFGNIEKAAVKVITIPQNDVEIEELYNEGYNEESVTRHYKTYLEDIVKEYSLMANMKGHPNVVYCDDLKYIQHGDGIGWDIFIKMELLTPLTKMLAKAFDEAQIIKAGKDIAAALVMCKSENIVHRDIKPQNIFVSKNGDYKLGDFGVAKVSEKTQSGTKIGTFEYMPPEVVMGKPYGAAADIYSLGLVLYWLLNNKKLPFLSQGKDIPTATEKQQAVLRRNSGEPIPEPLLGSNELKRIVLKACAFNPEDRYHSATDLISDLTELELTQKGFAHVNAEPLAESPQPKAEPVPMVEEEDEKTFAIGAEPIVAKNISALPFEIPEDSVVPSVVPEDKTQALEIVEDSEDKTVAFKPVPEPKTDIPAAEQPKVKKQENPQNEVNTQKEDKHKPEKPKKKKGKGGVVAIIIALLLLLLVVGGTVGAAFALGFIDFGNNDKSNNTPANGWKTIDGEKYYFDNGKLSTGFVEIDGKTYYFNDAMVVGKVEKINGRFFRFGDDGVMVTGFYNDGSNIYHYESYGAATSIGWFTVDGKYYYCLDEHGQIAKNSQIQIDNAHYYFDGNGVMITGTVTIDDIEHIYRDDGKLEYKVVKDEEFRVEYHYDGGLELLYKDVIKYDIAANYADETLMMNKMEYRYKLMDEEATNCAGVKMSLEIVSYDTMPVGNHTVYVRTNGSWKSVGAINVTSDQTKYDVVLTFRAPINFDAYAVVYPKSGYSYKYYASDFILRTYEN